MGEFWFAIAVVLEEGPPPGLVNWRGTAFVLSIGLWWLLIGISARLTARGWRRCGRALVAFAFCGVAAAGVLLCLTAYNWSWNWWL